MKFWADEHMDAAIVEQLRQNGQNVCDAAELETDIPDDEVLAIANLEGVLIGLREWA